MSQTLPPDVLFTISNYSKEHHLRIDEALEYFVRLGIKTEGLEPVNTNPATDSVSSDEVNPHSVLYARVPGYGFFSQISEVELDHIERASLAARAEDVRRND